MIEKYTRKLLASRISIAGLFTMLVIILTIPLIVIFSQNQQDLRQRAAAPTPNLLPPPDGNGSVAGYVYFDKNSNGEREAGETGIPNVQIKITQINNAANSQNTNADLVSIITTDTQGYFKYKFVNTPANTVTLSVKLILPQGYKTIDTNPILLTNLQKDAKQILQFGIFQFAIPTGAVTTPTPTCTPRPAECGPTKVCPFPPNAHWCPTTPLITSPTLTPPSKKGD